jgi:2-polyprenyl-3-methyl-5-hydroxy-6-metoxy-1,4-benzoquinol methylase
MPDPLEEVRRRRLIINRLDAWLYDEIRPYLGRRVLEVGSGHGNFIQHLLDRDLVVATDVEPSSVELVRERFAGYPHVRALVHDVCNPVDDELRAFRLDTIVSLNVLEHIEDDLTALSHMADML